MTATNIEATYRWITYTTNARALLNLTYAPNAMKNGTQMIPLMRTTTYIHRTTTIYILLQETKAWSKRKQLYKNVVFSVSEYRWSLGILEVALAVEEQVRLGRHEAFHLLFDGLRAFMYFSITVVSSRSLSSGFWWTTAFLCYSRM